MLENAKIFFQLGLQHILDLRGFDHILFVVSFCLLFGLRQWKQILALVTAFTLGHTLTLGLSTFDLLRVNDLWVEFLIPVTIIISAAKNIFNLLKRQNPKSSSFTYWLIGGFGLIHGLGFSNYLKALLVKQTDFALSLFSFNLGLEIGQVFIVGLTLLLLTLINQLAYARGIKVAISSIIIGISTHFAVENASELLKSLS